MKNFQLKNNSLIDTNFIYLSQGARLPNAIDSNPLPTTYYRFWSNGRVQQVWPGNQEIGTLVNNTEIGSAGYYRIRKGRLEMQITETLNGGQKGLRYGLFEQGNIWFYYQRPETYFGSWLMMRWLESKYKTQWVKTKVEGLKYVNPNW